MKKWANSLKTNEKWIILRLNGDSQNVLCSENAFKFPHAWITFVWPRTPLTANGFLFHGRQWTDFSNVPLSPRKAPSQPESPGTEPTDRPSEHQRSRGPHVRRSRYFFLSLEMRWVGFCHLQLGPGPIFKLSGRNVWLSYKQNRFQAARRWTDAEA